MQGEGIMPAQTRGIQAHTDRKKQETVARLKAAIAALEERGEPVSAASIQKECGLTFNTIRRNQDAYKLFREHSKHLKARDIHNEAREDHKATDTVAQLNRRQVEARLKRAEHQCQILAAKLDEATQRAEDAEKQCQNVRQHVIQQEIDIAKLKANQTRLTRALMQHAPEVYCALNLSSISSEG
jgi:hypothetical protein